MSELMSVIHGMPLGGAAGLDETPPNFLLALSDHILNFLLVILNLSWSSCQVPQALKILPLRQFSNPVNLSARILSYRSISLTFFVVKTLERLIASGLLYLADSNGWLSEKQAGFRSNHSWRDIPILLTHHIRDAFHSRERTVPAQLDYSKALDCVWQHEPIIILNNTSVPLHYCR